MVRPPHAAGRRWLTVCATTALLAAPLSAGAMAPGLLAPASASVEHAQTHVLTGGSEGLRVRQASHHGKAHKGHKAHKAHKAKKSKAAKARARAKAKAAAKAKAKAAAKAKALAAALALIQDKKKPVPGPVLPHPTPTPAPTSAPTPTSSPSPSDSASPTPSATPTTSPTPTSTPSTPSGDRLPWAAPTLASDHVTINVTNAAATRRISLKAGQDALIVLPDSALTDYSTVGLGDAMVTVSGGRNVVVMGGHIHIPKPAITTLTAPVSTDGTTLTVGSTAGYPSSGVLRLDGEGIVYSSKDATHFYVSQRRKGFFNTSAVSSQTTHAAGAPVYLGEAFRSGMSFQKQTGTVHIEGLLVDGFVNDGLRFSGGKAIVQVEKSRIGPNTNFDLSYQTDGHPDGIQAYGGGAKEIRLAQDTIVAGPNGNGLLNKGSDSGDGTIVSAWRLRDVEVLTTDGKARSLIANSDAGTTWDVVDGSIRYPSGFKKTVTPNIASKFTNRVYQSNQSDVAPEQSVGNGYRSAGYVS